MIAAAGIDTWSPCWYVDPHSVDGRALDEMATVPSKRGRLLSGSIAGHRVGWVRSSGLLYAEGHPCGAMPGQWSREPWLEDDVDRAARRAVDEAREPWLLPPGELPRAYEGLLEALSGSGVPVPPGWAREPFYAEQTVRDGVLEGWEREYGFAGLRRVDATVDIDAGTRARGLAILAGVAAMAAHVPRAQAATRWAKDGTGTIETVELYGFGGVKKLGRWYDKGLESGIAARGLVVRAEDQRRYPKGHRRGIGELEASYVRRQFQQRWLPLWQATKGVTVAGTTVLADKLVERIEEGEITVKQAELLGGHLLLARRGVRPGRTQLYERRAQLRKLGLVLADGVLEEVEVDLHEVLEEALESPAWGAQG